MIGNDRYKEIKITYIHILTFIIAFIAIGLLLFFLGYRIGKGSVKIDPATQNEEPFDKKIVKVNNSEKKEKNIPNNPIKKKNLTSEIDKELQMHNSIGIQNLKKNESVTPSKTITKTIEPEKFKRSTFYAIQIGAYRDHHGAKKVAQKFSKKYATEIEKNGDLYKVRIGSFKTEKQANLEIKKNPKLKGCYTVKIKR